MRDRAFFAESATEFKLVDPENGSVRELFSHKSSYASGDLGGWAVSPDGTEIAVLNSNFRTAEIEVFSLPGQLKHTIIVRGWSRLNGIDYSADGKDFYSGWIGFGNSTLLRVDRKGNATPLWRRVGTNIQVWAIPSPDGKYIALPANSSAENAWMMDGS